jgi:hypothetical protein
MGEVTPMREAVFHKAFSSVCAAKTDTSGRLPLQLGATQPFLLQTAEEVYSARTAELMAAAQAHQRVEDFNALSVSVHHLSDIYKQLHDLQKHGELFEQVYQMTVEWQDRYTARMEEKGSAVTSEDVNTYIHLLKRVAETSNDYFQSLRGDVERKERVAAATLHALDLMFENVDTESKPFARHMSALMLTNLGEMYYDSWVGLGGEQQGSPRGQRLLQLMVEKQELSVQYFREYLEGADNKSIQNEYSMAIQLLAIAYSSQNDIKNARENWSKAIDKSVKLTGGVEMGPYYSSLSRLYLNAAMCDMKGNFLTEAKEKLLLMMVVVINSGQATEAQINAKPFKGPPEIEMALSMLRDISMKDPARRKSAAAAQEVEEEEEEEWEDCEEGEEGCEEVFEGADGGSVRDDSNDDDDDDDKDDDDDEEEELRELAEIRAQYARQSRGFTASGGGGGSADTGAGDGEEEEEEWEECVEGEEGCEEVEEDAHGRIISPLPVKVPVKVTVGSLAELDEEYEECLPGEEGCEELEVEIVSDDDDDDDDDDDEEEEEEQRELAEIRAQYARQSKGFAIGDASSTTGLGSDGGGGSADTDAGDVEEEEEEWEECVEGEEGCEEVEEDAHGRIISPLPVKVPVKVTVGSLAELDVEYEECLPGEEGCEELEVEIVSDDDDDDDDDDDEEEEEQRELAEIRAQYARQVRRL